MMRKLILGTLLAAMSACFFACDKDEGFDEHKTEESSDDLLKGAASHVLMGLYNPVLLESGDTTFALKVGECIYASEPNKYYVVARNAEEAALFYNSRCTNDSWEVEYKEEGDSTKLVFDICDRTTTFGYYGSTSLTIGGESPAYATITLNLAEVGKEHTLVFVPESFMPNNTDYSSFKSPYKAGQIYKDNNNVYWLCVKPSTTAEDGYLIRFGDDGVKRQTYKDCCKKVQYSEVESGKDALATKDAWEHFLTMLSYGDGRNAYEFMRQDFDNASNMEYTMKVCATYYGDSEIVFKEELTGGKSGTITRTFKAQSSYHIQVGNYWRNNYAYCGWHVKHNYIFNCVNVHVSKLKYSWPGTTVRVSSVSTGSDIPMRMKSFKDKKFDKWTLVFPKN